MKYAVIAAVLLLATSVRAQTIPQLPLDPVNGVASIGFENTVGADTVVATLNRPDCPIAARASLDTLPANQGFIQVPSGLDTACLLRPGDRVSLQRYRDGVLVDTLGPYVVPVRLYFPIVKSDTISR